MPYQTHVAIDRRCTELLQALSLYLVNDNLLPCRLISSDGPYLHVEASLQDNSCAGELLIPHHCILFVATNAQGKTLGFLQGGT